MNKDIERFKKKFLKMIDNKDNKFHPLVFIVGNPKTGKNVQIGLFSEINAKETEVIIGDNCDIASFVSINAADSHKKCIGLKKETERKPIIIENNVFIGSHCFIGGGTKIGRYSVIGAGTILNNIEIPPYSLVVSSQSLIIKKGYYKKKLQELK